jgi:hypothetical protein
MDIHGSLLNQTIMYDFSKLPEIFHGIQVPDYLAFVTGRDGIVSTANTCEISYEPRIVAYVYGQYSSRELEQYVSFLEKNGFYIASMIKGEDYYLEKIIDKYKIVVNPYQLVRTGDIGVDITLIDNM